MDNGVVLEVLNYCMLLIHFWAFWRQNYADLKSQMEQWLLLGGQSLQSKGWSDSVGISFPGGQLGFSFIPGLKLPQQV